MLSLPFSHRTGFYIVHYQFFPDHRAGESGQREKEGRPFALLGFDPHISEIKFKKKNGAPKLDKAEECVVARCCAAGCIEGALRLERDLFQVL
jgi:hypothetical protein